MTIKSYESLDHPSHAKPSDKFAMFYFCWLGGAIQSGWNAAVNSFDYFASKYPNNDVTFVFPLPILVAQVFVTLSVTYLSKVVSFHTRVTVSLMTIIFLAACLPFQAKMFASDSATWGFGMYSIMSIILVIGFCTNLCWASVAGFASQISGKYTAYGLIGIGVFALGLNGIKEATLLTFSTADKGDIFPILVYFALVLSLVFMSLIFHMIFIRTDFYKAAIEDSMAPGLQQVQQIEDIERMEECQTALLSDEATMKAERNFKTLFEIFQSAKIYVILAFILNLQATIPYPGVMLKKYIPNMEDTTKTVSMITVFNIFFLIGKFVGKAREIYTKRAVIAVVILRFLLVALFIAQAVTTTMFIISTPWFGYLNDALFGLTLGFGNVALFYMVPEQVRKNKKEVAGFLTIIAINTGSTIGGFLALPLANLGGHSSTVAAAA